MPSFFVAKSVLNQILKSRYSKIGSKTAKTFMSTRFINVPKANMIDFKGRDILSPVKTEVEDLFARSYFLQKMSISMPNEEPGLPLLWKTGHILWHNHSRQMYLCMGYTINVIHLYRSFGKESFFPLKSIKFTLKRKAFDSD